MLEPFAEDLTVAWGWVAGVPFSGVGTRHFFMPRAGAGRGWQGLVSVTGHYFITFPSHFICLLVLRFKEFHGLKNSYFKKSHFSSYPTIWPMFHIKYGISGAVKNLK